MFGLNLIKEKDLADLRENLNLYQRTLEDVGWINTSLDQYGQQSLIGGSFEKMLQRCKIYYTKNPLAGYWIDQTTAFVFGEGVSTPKANDSKIQEIVDKFWNDPDNKLALTGYQAQILLSNKLQIEGNLFFMLFDDDAGDVRVRLMDAQHVTDVIKLPELGLLNPEVK